MGMDISDDRRKQLVLDLEGFFLAEFDETISPFRAEQLLDFFLQALGPHVYNQAVQDARAYMQGKLDDLEGEVFAR